MKYPLKERTVAVVGMGKSGLAAAELLLAHGARVAAVDSRTGDAMGEAGSVLAARNIPLRGQVRASFDDADLVVLSPGVPVDIPELQPVRGRGVPVIGEVELASWFLRGPVAGITGSNGKTTTTAMTGHVLRTAGVPCQVGGNIGTPPTAMIDASREDQWNVLELSSFQLETIDEFHAQIAAGLNVTPDHLDRHGTLEVYAGAKARLFETQRPGSCAVLNADDPVTKCWADRTKADTYWFSRRERVSRGICLEDGMLLLEGEPLLPASEVPLPGVHNIENTMAAALIAHLAGAPREGIIEGIRTFPGVEHRIEFVRERNGVRYYNDSKATNVDATEKAIDAFPGSLWIILGGKDKNSDYTVLREKLTEKAKGILLIGAAADKIAGHLEGLPLLRADTLDRAVELAAGRAADGDIVLLAPACASFDQFRSYEHRGRVFKDLVKEL